jgi:NAD-dependent dihydropyrimidine dehydrogenase PreA subunit
MSGNRKRVEPGLFVPTVDRTRCEGGYHGACAEAGSPCIQACPSSVLEIRRLTAEDRRRLSIGERLRAWVHGNQQPYAVRADQCTACAECVKACPQHVIKLTRRAA